MPQTSALPGKNASTPEGASIQAHTHAAAEPLTPRSALTRHWPFFLYAVLALLPCIWVLTLPLMPSQDGPLHLYYVQIFEQLLTHQHTTYTTLFHIRHYLPPYATYYYSLIGLHHFVSLETADKLFVACNILFLAFAGCYLLRSLHPRTRWAPFLLLPILLNWPLFMGFANYMLSINLSLLAIAFWCRAAHRSGWRYTVYFLVLIGCMILTHPLPWAFALGFASLELAIRGWRLRAGRSAHVRSRLWRDLIALALTCLSYLYLLPFRATTQLMTRLVFNKQHHTWEPVPRASTVPRFGYQALSLLHTQGLNLFQGGGAAHLCRVGLGTVFGGLFFLAVVSCVRRRQARMRWQLTDTWLVYAVLLAVGLIVVPDDGVGGYYVTTRMQILVYLCCVVAAANALERRPRLAVFASTLSAGVLLLTLSLAVHHLGATARKIAGLRSLPLPVESDRPGLLLRPPGTTFPENLNYDAYNWAPVHYFRWHHLLLYNTAWLGDRLIPIQPTPAAAGVLDDTFYNQAPTFGDAPLRNNQIAARTLSHTGFLLVQRDALRERQAALVETPGSQTPGVYAKGWSCPAKDAATWSLCQPAVAVGRQR